MNGYDLLYAAGLIISAPFWLLKSAARRKVLRALWERTGRSLPARGHGQAIMIHAVSLGEINATRLMVRGLADADPDLEFIVSTTTETGYTRAKELYGSHPRVTLIRYPLDLTRAVTRVLDGLRPVLVVLMELEVWPNFMRQCGLRHIPVVLVNGRLTAGSFHNYRLAGPLVKTMFRRLAAVCAQEPAYAARFIRLGAHPGRVQITGTMKFDTAQIVETVEGAYQLAADVGLRPGHEPIWVCGSTGPGEEDILLRIYQNILARFPALRLAIIPRKPERFDEVAALIKSAGFDLIRRSQPAVGNRQSAIPLVLGDTMGELRKFYSLADVVFVGRTLLDLGSRQHGSDMIEPAALAKPVIVGPFTGNFAEVMNHFRAAKAMSEISTPADLQREVERLLADRTAAQAMGRRARDVVRQEQGATHRHVEIILRELNGVQRRQPAAVV